MVDHVGVELALAGGLEPLDVLGEGEAPFRRAFFGVFGYELDPTDLPARVADGQVNHAGSAPGDLSAEQMEFVADLADRYSFGELRVSHEQNLVLTDVRVSDLPELHRALKTEHLATPYTGLLNDMISCPGGDYCSLANAKSIPVAESIQRRFDDYARLKHIGPMTLNISGCMNACGHHHVGHIGILGVDKNGEEWYQVEIGGNQSPASLGKVIGPSVSREQVPHVIERLLECYLAHRDSEAERFVDVVHRIGVEPFKEHVYGEPHQGPAHRRRQPVAA